MKKQYKYFLTFDKKTVNFVRAGIIGMTLASIIAALSVAFFAVASWRNSYEKTQAEIRYQDALIENIGKPQIIEQRYISPMKGE